MIGDRQVISYCPSLYIGGHWVSNPTQEQIFSDGWEIYVPPVIHPRPQDEPETTDIIQAVKRMFASEIENMTDEEAIEIAELYPTWASLLPKEGEQVGAEVQSGKRLWDDGKLWKVLQLHNVMPNWRPADSPGLYVEVNGIEEWPPIPEVITAEGKYMAGDKGTWRGNHYICKQNDCVWNPDQLPSAWELQPSAI